MTSDSGLAADGRRGGDPGAAPGDESRRAGTHPRSSTRTGRCWPPRTAPADRCASSTICCPAPGRRRRRRPKPSSARRCASAHPGGGATCCVDHVDCAGVGGDGTAARRRSLDPSTGFFQLGMDSLMSVTLQRSLSETLGEALTPAVVFDYPTVEALTDHLTTMLPEIAEADRSVADAYDNSRKPSRCNNFPRGSADSEHRNTGPPCVITDALRKIDDLCPSGDRRTGGHRTHRRRRDGVPASRRGEQPGAVLGAAARRAQRHRPRPARAVGRRACTTPTTTRCRGRSATARAVS